MVDVEALGLIGQKFCLVQFFIGVGICTINYVCECLLIWTRRTIKTTCWVPGVKK